MANLGSDLGNAAGAHPESGNKDHEIKWERNYRDATESTWTLE